MEDILGFGVFRRGFPVAEGMEFYLEESGVSELMRCPLAVALEAPSEAFQVLVMAEDRVIVFGQFFQHGEQLGGEFADSRVAPLFGCNVGGLAFEVDGDPFQPEEFSGSRTGFFAEL